MATCGVEEKIGKIGVVPVVVLNDSSHAVPLAKALLRGGLSCAEITFRTDAAGESIRLISESLPEVLVGAGTVLSIGQAEVAVQSGARFIVSPGFDAELVDWCLGEGVPVFPGCATPSEVMQCLKRGLRVVKLFPCGQLGGLSAIKAIGAPFPSIRFMPTGGVSADNLSEFLASPKVAACGGTWVAKQALVDAGDYDTIEALAREAAGIVALARRGA